MKTETKQVGSDQMEKESLIDFIAEVLKKHCTTRHDVESVICAITGANEFLSAQLATRNDIVYDIRIIEDIVRSRGDIKLQDACSDVSDTFIRGMILSGQLNTGCQLIWAMSDDLNSLS